MSLDLHSIIVAALDIAIVAYFIYRALLLIRGTSAAYILVGLLLLAGLYFVANLLTLTTVSWLLNHLISYLIIIVIIVFQGDIRRGLGRMGRKMFSPSVLSEDITVIEEVVQACEIMAKNNIGALIIFEREADLSEFVQPGTPLDARVTKALLVNALTPWPDNPLHDGAVMIKGNRIIQAGGILPLSRNPGLDKELGTRHRAAVGITEETDAIAVIVSEQRGSIGLCTSGLLHMALNGPSLRRELLALLSLSEKSRWAWVNQLVQRVVVLFNGTSSTMEPQRSEKRGDQTSPMIDTVISREGTPTDSPPASKRPS